jgi:hypothetical protein
MFIMVVNLSQTEALVDSSPTLLILGRNSRGADSIMSEIVINDCFDNSEFKKYQELLFQIPGNFYASSFMKGKTQKLNCYQT